jgi:hypothetical protein
MPSLRPATNGSVITPMNCVMALKVVCWLPVAVSPDACDSPDGVSELYSIGMPPVALKKWVRALPTLCGLPLRPPGIAKFSARLR